MRLNLESGSSVIKGDDASVVDNGMDPGLVDTLSGAMGFQTVNALVRASG
jgi:hypothetical protein